MPIQPATGSIRCVVSKTTTLVKVLGKDSDTAKANLSLGYANAVVIGSPTSPRSDGTFGKSLQIGLVKNTTDGSPFSQTPCLQLDYPGFWRFRWSVRSGTRSVYINAKQTSNGIAEQRPAVIVKANSDVGLLSDVIVAAEEGNDWVTIGPVTFTSTGTGMVWVELHNRCQTSNCPALFDHIVTT